jgi:uncharacterized damage-inducible protein DinB
MKRRNFLSASALMSVPVALTGCSQEAVNKPFTGKDLHMIGPVEGYTPFIGTIVSMLNKNRDALLKQVEGLSDADADFLLDPGANSIGALLMHLGATEKYYQANTFENRQDYNEEEKKFWGPAYDLGEQGRQTWKGKPLAWYIEQITLVRNQTLEKLKEYDDAWLLKEDPEWSQEEPYNNFYKWFHVCEHESNHRGQIAFLKSRLPGL